MRRIAMASWLLALMGVMSGCVFAPRDGNREGSYDRTHNRYYHENSWHDCTDRNEHCH